MTRQLTFQLWVAFSLIATIGFALEDIDPGSDETTLAAKPVAEQHVIAPNELDGGTNGQLRLREGAKLVNQIGELHEAGGVIAFYPDGETYSLQLLENLALERVSRDLDQIHRKWSVTGVVTEYKGSNYLLLQRAVLKARVSNSAGPRS